MLRKVKPDMQLSTALVKSADSLLLFLQPQQINATSSSPIFVLYYEAFRQIVEAIAAKQGYRTSTHESVVTFLQQLNEQFLAFQFEKFRKIRNDVNYLGTAVELEIVQEIQLKVTSAVEMLRKKYLLV